ncbi:siderophore-interacting protein [Microbacterium allomyrinae]|uniref:Siderophore-interacting protein n=1 Tax=Microbacterium allomyrinae TaxID=2830666 RepID=A0A9X1S2Z5_9MICO|nr:siderophore-interacting protein [Microbacterium allomyrinae]MCC2033221.1 siderophore-interacting protein [Microbacterium allomyrinae]
MTDASTVRRDDGQRPARPAVDPSSPFFRAGGRNRFTARRARAIAVEQVAPVLLRVRLTGPDFGDFTSGGPGDHVRVYFPDPVSGELVAPTAAGPGEDGIVRPDAPTHARDFTPLRVVRRGGDIAIDLDFFLHDSPGPAALWAASARMGDELVVVGPRGSKAAPQGAARLLLVCDETALPSATRWAAEVPATTSVDLVALTCDDGSWVPEYIASASGRSDVRVHHLDVDAGADALVALVDRIGPDASTFLFAAGEASALVPLRRHLRRTLALSAEQVALSGYWKRGQAAFDHHSPVDPSDPDH